MNTEAVKHPLRMRLWCAFAAAGLMVALLIFIALSAKRPPMPSHAGRSAESWLKGVTGVVVSISLDTPIVQAFEAMGTNGIAFLVDALDRQDPPWRRFHRMVFPKLPSALQQRFPLPPDPDKTAWQAMLVLSSLHDFAPGMSFPPLVRVLNSGNRTRRESASSAILSYSWKWSQFDFTPYRPQLIQALNDNEDWVRINVARFLVQARLSGPELAPALQRPLTSSIPLRRQRAKEVLDQLPLSQQSGSSSSHAL